MYVITCLIYGKLGPYLGDCYYANTFDKAKEFAIKLAEHYCSDLSEDEIKWIMEEDGHFLYDKYEILIRKTINE